MTETREWTSPARARQRASYSEYLLTKRMERSAEIFLAEIYSLASAAYPSLPLPPQLDVAYERFTTNALNAPGAALDRDYLLEALRIDESMIDEAYAMLTDARHSTPTKEAYTTALKLTLALTEPTPDQLTAAGAWDVLGPAIGWLARVRRIARTSVTGMDSLLVLQAARVFGFTHKQWVSRHDNATRPTHLEVDGTVIPITQPFIVGGYSLDRPGDRSGPPEEVFNCRCSLVLKA